MSTSKKSKIWIAICLAIAGIPIIWLIIDDIKMRIEISQVNEICGAIKEGDKVLSVIQKIEGTNLRFTSRTITEGVSNIVICAAGTRCGHACKIEIDGEFVNNARIRN